MRQLCFDNVEDSGAENTFEEFKNFDEFQTRNYILAVPNISSFDNASINEGQPKIPQIQHIRKPDSNCNIMKIIDSSCCSIVND